MTVNRPFSENISISGNLNTLGAVKDINIFLEKPFRLF